MLGLQRSQSLVIACVQRQLCTGVLTSLSQEGSKDPHAAPARCLGPAEARPSAVELLEDAFIQKRREAPDVQRRPSAAALDSHASVGDAARQLSWLLTIGCFNEDLRRSLLRVC